MLLDETTFLLYVISGTSFLLLLTSAIVSFIFIYQKRIYKKHQELVRVENIRQQSIIEAIITTKETEKRRIAHELHDEIGSHLTYLKMKLIHLDIKEDIRNELKQEISELGASLKRITNEMLPAVLDEFGFEKAMEYLVKKLNESKSTYFHLHPMNMVDIPLDKSHTHSLYLTIKELLTNIQKHAQAKEVNLSIKNKRDMLQIIIEDDGIPFRANEYYPTNKKSLGLSTIQGRLLQLRASMHWEPRNKPGNKLTILIKSNAS